MNVNELAKKLPTEPRVSMRNWITEKIFDLELGGDFCIFKREAVYIEDASNYRTIYPHDFNKLVYGGASRYGADCKCTACGEHFTTGFLNKNYLDKYGIKMYCGDDGINYEGYIHPDEAEYDIMDYHEGESIICPRCGEQIQLIHKSRLKSKRVYQHLIVSVEVADGYAILMTWLAKRTLSASGNFQVDIFPREAYAIGKNKLHRFTHTQINYGLYDKPLKGWKSLRYCGEDLALRPYYDYNKNHSSHEYSVYMNIPELAGTTGEKTGLYDYIKYDNDYGCMPFGYLIAWKQHPNIENLIKSHWRRVIDSMIYKYGYEENHHNSMTYAVDGEELIDWDEVKPHRMLQITKEEYKEDMMWDYECLLTYGYYRNFVGEISATDMDFCLTSIGLEYTREIIQSSEYDKSYNLLTVMNYLCRQEEINNEFLENLAEIFIDYRFMLEGGADGPYTHEELWPRNIVVAHNRITEQKKIKVQKEYIEGFKNNAKKYAELAYTDGDLCVRVAQNQQELIDEGSTLRHCVGDYGGKHCSGSDVIFFVRRYRRPERSYYTLDINFLGAVPHEVQLHGYGNEHHGANKEHTHSIPCKVREFCDKWEKEILIPWSREQMKNKTEAKTA